MIKIQKKNKACKKGLSNIVTILLIIVISMALIILLWYAIKNLFNELGSNDNTLTCLTVELIPQTCIYSEGNSSGGNRIALLEYLRSENDAQITDLKALFKDNNNKRIMKNTDDKIINHFIPTSSMDTRSILFDIGNFKPVEVSIAPVIGDKKKTCSEGISIRCSETKIITNSCPDINDDDSIDYNDILEFLNLYNAQNPRADVYPDGVINDMDLFGFLHIYYNYLEFISYCNDVP